MAVLDEDAVADAAPVEPASVDDLVADDAGEPADEPPAPKGPRRYDFRRPNKFSREHVRALQIVHEAFARQFATILSTSLRAVSQVQLRSIDQLSYDDFLIGVPNPSMLVLVSLEPLAGAGILQVPLPLTMSAIDRMLGGSGTGPYPSRPPTDIEETLIRELLERVLRELGSAFESLTPLHPQIVQLESNPQFAQIAAPSDMVVVMRFDARIGSEEATVSLCIPFTALQPVLERVAGHTLFNDRPAGDVAAAAAALAESLERAPVDVRVRFEPVALTSREIIGLRPGDVLPLQHDVNRPLTVVAGGSPILRARAGRKGNRLAFRITEPESA